MFYNFVCWVVRGIFRLLYRVEVEGVEKIPSGKGFVVAPNHLSNLDPPLLGAFLPVKMKYMAKEELFRIPIFGKLISSLGAFPVKRGGRDVAAVRAAVGQLKKGGQVVIFPEGRRARVRGVLGKGKPGAVMIAAHAGVGVLPVGISATYRFRSRVTIRIGDMIEPCENGEKLNSDGINHLTQEVLMPCIASLAEVKPYAG